MLLSALLFPVALLTAQSGAAHASIDPSIYPDAAGMPPDVQDFIVDYDDCQHWLGEEPYDADRKREIDEAVGKLCPKIDARRVRLMKRYRDNPSVSARLADYEVLGK